MDAQLDRVDHPEAQGRSSMLKTWDEPLRYLLRPTIKASYPELFKKFRRDNTAEGNFVMALLRTQKIPQNGSRRKLLLLTSLGNIDNAEKVNTLLIKAGRPDQPCL